MYSGTFRPSDFQNKKISPDLWKTWATWPICGLGLGNRLFTPSPHLIRHLNLDKKKETTNNVWTVLLTPKGTYFFARKIVKINLPVCIKILSAFYWL
jgi:hypothetical protein